MENENNKNQDILFQDDLIWLKNESKSIFQIRRKYVKILPEDKVYYPVESKMEARGVNASYLEEYSSHPNLARIVAKGISAFLSFQNINTEYGYSLRYRMAKNMAFNIDDIFQQYFNHCYKFLEIENNKLLPPKRKSESKLILFHLQNEEKLFAESQQLFDEVLEFDKSVIKVIKEAALYYRTWLKELHFTEEKKVKDLSKKTRTDKNLYPLTFQGLFRNKENAKIVKDILETKGFTVNKEWQGDSTKLSELACVYFALRFKAILTAGMVAPQVKTFYREFGLTEDYTTSKTMGTELFNDDREKFDKIFSHLI